MRIKGFLSKMNRNSILLIALVVSVIVLSTNLGLTTLWINNKMPLLRALDFQQVQPMAVKMDGNMTQETDIQWSVVEKPTSLEQLTVQGENQWSDIKLVIYMTTHLPESHLLFFPCWNDAIQRLEIFRYADLILYTAVEPTPEQLALLPFKNTTIKLYNNTGYQEGAVQSMIDPFVDNVTWFDEYDWVIRLNPDVLIRHDTWLIETMMNPSFDAIFHDCYNSKDYSNPTPLLQSDFYAFRPSAVNRDMFLNALDKSSAERHLTAAFRSIYDSRRFAFVEGAINSVPSECRIEGVDSPVVHIHELSMSCPYYYNATRENVY
jgi:hypothetical protein